MWEKIKNWWNEHKEHREEKRLKEMLNAEIALSMMLGGPPYTIYDIHVIPKLICSIYFESDKEWIIVDFSQEKEGIAHFIIYTQDTITDYKNGKDQDSKEIHTIVKNAKVYKKYYRDGSEGWCFS